MTEISRAEWLEILNHLPDVHLLQTSQWGELKSYFGWEAAYLWVGETAADGIGAQILFRNIPFGKTVAYLPKGPIGVKVAPLLWDRFLKSIDSICRERGAIFLIIEPDLWQQDSKDWISQLWSPEYEASFAAQGGAALPPGLSTGFQVVQPARTIIVDLSQDVSAILARMKQKTRYNIRLAEKKGVSIQSSSDMETFHQLLTVTGSRDGFGVHSLLYYQKAYDLFHPNNNCEVFLADYHQHILAGLMVFRQGKRAWYFYGGSSDDNRELMPNYLLQWEAMRWAKENGCNSYDLWGIPDYDEADLEANFATRNDGLWGVYRFKRGFGGEIRRSAGPWNRVYQPQLYRFYRWWYNRQRRNLD